MQQTSARETTRWRHQREKVILNPDHAALGSFGTSDIPEGTKVFLPTDAQGAYVWKNSQVVADKP